MNEDKRQDVGDTVRITMAATWASPKPAPVTKATITRLFQCHCLSAVCDPRSRISPLYGRRDKSAKAETHRIEEVVDALYRFKPAQIPRAEERCGADQESSLPVFWKEAL